VKPLLICLTLLTAQPAPPALQSRPAEEPEAKVGTITGALTPAQTVRQVHAVDRNLDLTYPAEIDAKTGSFTVADVIVGRYDLVVTTTDGVRLEGADLSYRESELEELARQEEVKQGIVREPPGPLTDEDRQWLTDHVFGVKRFEDFRKIDAIAGNDQRATMLVELLRRRPFHGMNGSEVIWRVELWYFQKQAGGWEHVADTDVVLERRRMPAAEFAKLRHVFLPALGRIAVDAEGKSVPVAVALPANPKTDEGFTEGAS
jgi:hypothetical protein